MPRFEEQRRRRWAFVPGGNEKESLPKATTPMPAGGAVEDAPPAYSQLVLTRGAHQGVLIGDHVLVSVDRARGNDGQVRLSITAPRTLKILRSELVEPQKLTQLMERYRTKHSEDDGQRLAAVDEEIVGILRNGSESEWLRSALSAALEADPGQVALDSMRLMDVLTRRRNAV